MNFSSKLSLSKKNKSWPNFLIGAIALLLFIIAVNFFGSAIKNGFYALSSPVQKTFWTAGESSSSFLGSFLNAASLTKENQNLKNENQKLLSQIVALQEIEQGNKAQSQVSLTCQNSGFKLLMAGVVGLNNDDTLSINKGANDGVAVGMPVIDQQNALYGRVFKVYKNFSQVLLISSKNSVVNVKIQQNPWTIDPSTGNLPAEIDGVVKGSGGLKAYLDLIPISDEINESDVLVTSSIDNIFPKDLLVGKITKKEKNDQKPFQQAQTNLFFNVKTTDNLFIITNYKNSK